VAIVQLVEVDHSDAAALATTFEAQRTLRQPPVRLMTSPAYGLLASHAQKSPYFSSVQYFGQRVENIGVSKSVYIEQVYVSGVNVNDVPAARSVA
jgi:hypothetical protein